MDERNWFQKKWGTLGEVPTEVLLKRIEELEERIVRLEEENVETTNTLYEIMHSVDAVDARIDILADDWGEQFNE
jgi:septal ring factor EnvC (AmiA/AmiB activator)